MEPLPDIGRMSDEALRDLVEQLLGELDAAPDDRFLLGKIDILRAEIVHRGGDPFAKS
jgi:hypothetical protein